MIAANGALAIRPRPTGPGAEQVSPLVRRALLLAGVGAAGCSGALAAALGAGTLALLLFAAAALLAAVLSSYAALALLIIMLLVPIGSAGQLPVRLNEIDAIFAAALAGLAIRLLTSRERFSPTPLTLATAAYLTAGVVALTAGVLGTGETAVALSHFRGLFGFALIPVLLLSLGEKGPERRGKLLLLLCGVGVLTAGRGVLSWAELNGLVHVGGVLHRIAAPDDVVVGAIPALSGDFGYLRAVTGNFEGNSLGAFTLMLLPVAVYLALGRGSALVRLGFAAGAVLLLVALLVSYSRGAYLGLAIAAVPVLLLLGRRRPLTAVAITGAGALLLIFLINQLPGTEDRVATLRSLGQDATVQHRQLVYEEAALEIARSPVWGVGLGTNIGVSGAGADSLYVFLPLRGGLLLTAAFLGLLWAAGRHVLVAWRKRWLRGLDVAVLVGLIGFAGHSLVDYTLWNPKVALTLWLLVGFVMATALERRTSVVKNDEPVQVERPNGEVPR